MEVKQARFGVVIIPTVSERVVLDNKLIRRVAVQRLNRAITPRIVNIRANLYAGRTVNAYDVAESLGGSPTNIPWGY